MPLKFPKHDPFYNPERMIFRPIYIILAKLSTQNYNSEPENLDIYISLKYHTHIYNLSRKSHPIFSDHPFIPIYSLLTPYPAGCVTQSRGHSVVVDGPQRVGEGWRRGYDILSVKSLKGQQSYVLHSLVQIKLVARQVA